MNKEIMEIALSNRAFLYAYVTRAFAAEPDQVFLDVVVDAHTMEEMRAGDDEQGRYKGSQQRLEQLVSSSNMLEQLRTEYTKIMIGPGKTLVPIHESIYVTGEELLFQEHTLTVRQAYRSAGYQVQGYPREADDHLAAELDFMAQLAQETQHAYEQGDTEVYHAALETQRKFLEEHLLRWLPEFSARLAEQHGISCFYPVLAELAVALCRNDFTLLNELSVT